MRAIVYPIHLNPIGIPWAPHLLVANVGGHQVVVGRHYEEGQLGIYLPEGMIVPDKLAEEMWVLGKLGGAKHNRVSKAGSWLMSGPAVCSMAAKAHHGILSGSKART